MGVDDHRIAWAAPGDQLALRPLMRAPYAHETPDAAAPTDARLQAHLDLLLAPSTPQRLAVIFDATGAALGLAAVGLFVSVADPRPTHWRQMELKELFVLPGHRGRGLGRALMRWVAAQARAQSACRLDWHVKRGNARGIAFYGSIGASVIEDRMSMHKPIPTQDAEQQK